jgi:hypothetical protein
MSPLTTIGPDALVSEKEARAYLQVEEADKPSKELLAELINGLSARISQYTGTGYIGDAEDKEASRLYRYYLADPSVDIDPVREISKLEVSASPSTEGTWEALAADNWIGEPLGEPVTTQLRFLFETAPATGVGWSALAAHVSGWEPEGTPWPKYDRALLSAYTVVRVTGKFGYGKDAATVPDNVKLALLMWLQNIWKRDQAFFSDNVAEVIAGVGMPRDVKELLEGAETSEAPSVEPV